MYQAKLISWTSLGYTVMGILFAVVLTLVGFSLLDWQWWLLVSVFVILHTIGLVRGYTDGKRSLKE